MKNLLPVILIVFSFVACKSNADNYQGRDIQLLTDTTAYQNNIFSDTVAAPQASEKVVAEEKPVQKVVVIREVVRVPASSGNTASVNTSTGNTTSVPPVVATPPVVEAPAPSNNDAGVGEGHTAGTVGTIPQPEEKKKGWNKATQGAVIGGATGAVGGAIISKKKGLGAVVGGVVGAAGGYILGKKMDKKDGK